MREVLTFKNIVIPETPQSTITMRIFGPQLVVHSWGQKAKIQLGHTEKKAENKKGLRYPKLEFEAAKYRTVDGADGIPVTGLKRAVASATVLVDDINRVDVYRSVFIDPHAKSHDGVFDLLKLEFAECRMREDVCRLSGPSKSPDMRWRPEYVDWSTTFTAHYNPLVISTAQIVHLVKIAGVNIGLHEGRPEKSALGWGTFEIDLESILVREWRKKASAAS